MCTGVQGDGHRGGETMGDRHLPAGHIDPG